MDRSPKLSSFEGLRGIAAFVVIVCHLRFALYGHTFPRGWPDPVDPVDTPAELLNALSLGLTDGLFAVWLFWIMSGFVLSLKFFLQARHGTAEAARDYLEDALLRRYPRLFLPALASVGLAFVLMRAGLMSNHRLAEYLGPTEGSGWLTSKYNFAPSLAGAVKSAGWNTFFRYDPETTYNTALWTMEKEYFGSLFLFAFLALVGCRSSRFPAYILAFVVNQRLGLEWLNAFVGGIALCDAYVNRDGMGAIAGLLDRPGVVRLRESPWFAAAGWFAVILGAGLSLNRLMLGLAAVALTLLSRPTQRVLSRRLPMYLGRISFGLYLVHTPIICSFSGLAFFALVGTMGRPAAAFLVAAATCVLSVALGHVFAIAFDQPAIRLSRAFADLVRKIARWRPAGVSLAVVGDSPSINSPGAGDPRPS